MKAEVSFLVSAAFSSKISTFFFSISTNTFSNSLPIILSEIDSNLSKTISLKLNLFFSLQAARTHLVQGKNTLATLLGLMMSHLVVVQHR